MKLWEREAEVLFETMNVVFTREWGEFRACIEEVDQLTDEKAEHLVHVRGRVLEALKDEDNGTIIRVLEMLLLQVVLCLPPDAQEAFFGIKVEPSMSTVERVFRLITGGLEQ